MTKFVVKFVNLEEQTKEEFEYYDLLSAITVIKNTPIEGVFMSDVQFENELILLLTSMFIHAGRKSPEYPEGKDMIMLVRRDENNNEGPVYGPHIVPFVAGSTVNVPPVAKIKSIPSQSWDPVREKQMLLSTDSETDING